MQLTIDIPDPIVRELLNDHDDIETAIQEAAALYQQMDVPPEVRAEAQAEIDAHTTTAPRS